MGEDDEAAVRGPGRGHGFALDVGDLAQVAARGLDQPHVGGQAAGLLDEGQGGAEEGTAAGQHFEQVGAEAVGHFGQVAGAHLGIFLAEQAAAGIGLEGADLHGAGAAVAVGPVGGDHDVRTGQLEAFEIQARGLVAGQQGAAQHGGGGRQAHEGQEAEVLLHQLLQFGAHAAGLLLGTGEGRGQGEVHDILAGAVDIDTHGGLGGAAQGQRDGQGQKDGKTFHGVMVLVVVSSAPELG